MKEIIEFFEKLLTSFTWSRLTFTLVVCFMLVGSGIGYEIYTSHFKLNRLSNEVKILNQLITISEKVEVTNKQELIDKAFILTLAEYTSLFNKNKQLNQSAYWPLAEINNLPGWLSKSLYILLPWFVLSIFFLLTMSGGKSAAIGGVLAIAILWLFIGMFLPKFENPLIMQLWFPWGAMAFTLLLIFYLDRIKKRKAAFNQA